MWYVIEGVVCLVLGFLAYPLVVKKNPKVGDAVGKVEP